MEFKSEYYEMISIIETYKHDRITFKDANTMLEMLRDRKKQNLKMYYE